MSAPTQEGATLDAPLTHRQIVTILIGLMMGMFLAALDQTIVASAIRVIADDLHGLSSMAWVTTAYLITSTIVDPAVRQALGHLRAQAVLHHRHHDLHDRVGAVCLRLVDRVARRLPRRPGPGRRRPVRAWRWPSSATSCRRGSGPSTRATSWPCSARPASSGRSSAACSPVRTPCSASTGWRWVFLVNVPIGGRRARRRHPDAAPAPPPPRPPDRLVGRRRADGRARPAAHRRRAGPGVGLDVRAVDRVLRDRRRGPDRVVLHRALRWATRRSSRCACSRNRTVAVASITSVFVGMGMFGGLAALPLYLQIVKGATPTEAGLQLLPMMLGIMFGSILSGQLISRTGRYRQYPIIGAGLLVVVALDVPLRHVGHPAVEDHAGDGRCSASGSGSTSSRSTLAIQNAVSPRDIGVATSSATFTRQIGGTLGTAVFLSILFSSARRQDRRGLPDARRRRGLPGGSAQPGRRRQRPTAPSSSSCRLPRRPGPPVTPSATLSTTPRSCSRSTRDWLRRSSSASPRRCPSCSWSRRWSWSSRSSRRGSCRTSSCAAGRHTTSATQRTRRWPRLRPRTTVRRRGASRGSRWQLAPLLGGATKEHTATDRVPTDPGPSGSTKPQGPSPTSRLSPPRPMASRARTNQRAATSGATEADRSAWPDQRPTARRSGRRPAG